MSDDDELHEPREEEGRVEIPLREGELLAAPVRYAVPATELPPLEVDTFVTYGEPGKWWAIDEALVATAPHGSGEDERYGLFVLTEDVSAALRGEEIDSSSTAQGLWMKTTDLWVYRDAEDQDVLEIEEYRSTAWFDRMPPDDLTPPAVRRPRPARELPSLIGRRLRAYGGGEWHWLAAVSEPLAIEDSILVKVVGLTTRGRMVGGRGLPDEELMFVSLHRLWAY